MAAKWTTAQIPDLTGQTIVVTGGNSGIGWEAALVLARHGAQTVLACRDLTRARDAAERIRAVHGSAQVEVMTLDLASLASVQTFAQQFQQRFPRLDVLVNNAGVMAIPRRTTADGFEMQFGTNHLGHFALTMQLLNSLIASGHGRVVTVSSGVHWNGRIRFDDLHGEKSYKKWAAYSQSKLANLLFMAELQRRLEAAKLPVISVACHPGYAATNLQLAGPRMTGSSFGERFFSLGNALFAQSAASGALPTLYAATAQDVKGGEYFGPRVFGAWGAPTRARRSALASNAEIAKQLWDVSVQLTHVSDDRLARAA